MQYRKLVKSGPDISLLGFGCMRFQSKNGQVDRELAIKQMKLAYDGGVNYYDTAYPYHGGKSEEILGEFIQRYQIRSNVYIADKLPTYLVIKEEQIYDFFSTQMERLNTDYIDFYLMHTLTSFKDWEKLKRLGIITFVNEKKRLGQIRYIGFSFHGMAEEFIKILEDYSWDFCQIQYNYLDENNQAGKKGLKKAYNLGIGVVIMEPLRGGALAAKAPDKVKSLLYQYDENRSVAYWSLRFVMNHKEVATVLSGMNLEEHIEENIKVASETKPGSMSEEEHEVIKKVKDLYVELMKVPCTACNYCMPCPFGVDIPAIFNDYNSKYFFGNSKVTRLFYIGKCVGLMGDKKSGSNCCTNCGACKKHCPQKINIPEKLKEAHKELDNWPLRMVLSVVVKIRKGRK